MFSFASETFTFTAEGSCGRYAVTWYGLPAATRPVVQPVRSKSEPPAPSKMNRKTCRICFILEKLEGTLSTVGNVAAGVLARGIVTLAAGDSLSTTDDPYWSFLSIQRSTFAEAA